MELGGRELDLCIRENEPLSRARDSEGTDIKRPLNKMRRGNGGLHNEHNISTYRTKRGTLEQEASGKRTKTTKEKQNARGPEDQQPTSLRDVRGVHSDIKRRQNKKNKKLTK